jgi:hypothetical protein
VVKGTLKCERDSQNPRRNPALSRPGQTEARLPATTTAAATAATITATAATTATSVATTATAAETTAATAAMSTAAAFTGSLRLGLRYSQSTSFDFLAIQGFDSLSSFIFRAHFDEPETLAAARLTILDDRNRIDISELREKVSQAILSLRIGDISYVQFLSHKYLQL